MKIQVLIMCAALALALAVGCKQQGSPGSESGTDQGTGTRSQDTNQVPSTNNPTTNQTSTPQAP